MKSDVQVIQQRRKSIRHIAVFWIFKAENRRKDMFSVLGRIFFLELVWEVQGRRCLASFFCDLGEGLWDVHDLQDLQDLFDLKEFQDLETGIVKTL